MKTILATLIVIALLALTAYLIHRARSDSGPARQVRSTLPALRLPDGGPVQVMAGVVHYLLRHAISTSAGLAAQPRNWLRVSGWIDLGTLPECDAHISINLRNNVTQRNADLFPPDNPGAVTQGHGVIIGTMGPGQPDFAPDSETTFCAVVEQFDKAEGMRVLLPETRSPPLPRRVWCSVVSARDGHTMRLRYLIEGDGVQFDSGWIATQHSQPVDGDDVTRALFPLVEAGVQHEPAECVWSLDELAPVSVREEAFA